MKHTHNIILLIIVLISNNIDAQISRAYYEAPDITTILFYKESEPRTLPVIKIGSGEKLDLQFDEIDGNTRSLMYKFEHCDAQWHQSDIIEMDYVEGLNKFYDIEKSHLSFNTTTDYVHYDIKLSTTPLLISGNYILSVYDATSEELLLQRPFMITEELVGVNSRLVREGNVRDARHKISFSIVHPALKIPTPAIELKIAVWQNMRIGEAIMASQPTYIRNNELVYDDDEEISFEAGNECRWIDNRSLKYVRSNTKSIDYYEPYYHFTLYPDGTSKGYYYYEDFNGSRYIEARDIYEEAAYAADYNFVHFTLPRATNDADIYIYGELTNWNLDERNKMTYNEQTRCYEHTLRIKQGLHNYEYMSIPQATQKPELTMIENSFQETENDYYIAVYYRSYSDTYDRLICLKRHNSLKTINSFIH